jgi:hypothetical protein
VEFESSLLSVNVHIVTLYGTQLLFAFSNVTVGGLQKSLGNISDRALRFHKVQLHDRLLLHNVCADIRDVHMFRLSQIFSLLLCDCDKFAHVSLQQ